MVYGDYAEFGLTYENASRSRLEKPTIPTPTNFSTVMGNGGVMSGNGLPSLGEVGQQSRGGRLSGMKEAIDKSKRIPQDIFTRNAIFLNSPAHRGDETQS